MRIMRTAVQADLAVNGLAYLGVLLLFAGLFGVVAFSFSSVRVGFRPVAEVVAPAAVLGSAWLLSRRKLVVPARALTILGGLLLLVTALAAFVDDAPVPPDLAGIPLVVALSAGPAVLAAAYALWARHRPASPLRQLVAPALWLAVAMAALGWHRPDPYWPGHRYSAARAVRGGTGGNHGNAGSVQYPARPPTARRDLPCGADRPGGRGPDRGPCRRLCGLAGRAGRGLWRGSGPGTRAVRGPCSWRASRRSAGRDRRPDRVRAGAGTRRRLGRS